MSDPTDDAQPSALFGDLALTPATAAPAPSASSFAVSGKSLGFGLSSGVDAGALAPAYVLPSVSVGKTFAFIRKVDDLCLSSSGQSGGTKFCIGLKDNCVTQSHVENKVKNIQNGLFILSSQGGNHRCATCLVNPSIAEGRLSLNVIEDILGRTFSLEDAGDHVTMLNLQVIGSVNDQDLAVKQHAKKAAEFQTPKKVLPDVFAPKRNSGRFQEERE